MARHPFVNLNPEVGSLRNVRNCAKTNQWIRNENQMRVTFSIMILMAALSCIANEQAQHAGTAEPGQRYTEAMLRYEIKREQVIESIAEAFHQDLLPAIHEIRPSLEIGRLTERNESWPPAFRKHGIRFIVLQDSQIRLFLHKWVSKAEIIVYYFDLSEAPQNEARKQVDADESQRPNPEIIKIFDDLWYWSFRG